MKNEHLPTDSDLLWTPSPERRESANLTAYIEWLHKARNLRFDDYESLWQWSVNDLEGFWDSIWSFFAVGQSCQHDRVLADVHMPGAKWFPGARLNFVDQIFRYSRSDSPAIIFQSEALGSGTLSWAELNRQTGAFAETLRRVGIRRGDRVAAYLPNIPQTVVAFLATASIGAIWSVCGQDMGVVSVTDRFGQIAPKVLIASDGYRFGGKDFDRRDSIETLLANLPSIQTVVWIALIKLQRDVLPAICANRAINWEDAIQQESALRTEQVAFDHPLWIVYSSGTTGLPKGIVHGHGGALAIGLTMAGLHWDLKKDARCFWYASTGWIMWNLQIMGLLIGSTICLFDGAAAGTGQESDWMTLWRFAAIHRVTMFGAGAAYFAACLKARTEPGSEENLDALQTVGSTGSPLSPECYRWIYGSVKRDVCLLCTSGGTDISGSFLTGSPTLPVYLGEMQCRNLGAAVHAFNEAGNPVLNAVGELVCTMPMPSMPLYFWDDRDGGRYIESYFNTYSGPNGERIWRHGDWLKLTPRPEAVGGVIYGRSDATINRLGIRMGTAELYRIVEAHEDVIDSLAIDLEYLGRPSYLGLFVVLQPHKTLDPQLIEELRARIKIALSPHHVPNEIVQVSAIPYTLTGKKLEVPIKKLLLGQAAESFINRDAILNSEIIDWFIEFAAKRSTA